MEAVRTVKPSRYPLPLHTLPLSDHIRTPANENAPVRADGSIAARAIAAAERAGHLPPQTTEKFLSACRLSAAKLEAANLTAANDSAAELAPSKRQAAPDLFDAADAADAVDGIAARYADPAEPAEKPAAGVTVAERARKAVARHAAFKASRGSTGSGIECEDAGELDQAPTDLSGAIATEFVAGPEGLIATEFLTPSTTNDQAPEQSA